MKLRTWKDENGRRDWTHALPVIAFAMNRQVHASLPNGVSPYEIMFGRKSRWEDRVPTHIRHVTEVPEEADRAVQDRSSPSAEPGSAFSDIQSVELEGMSSLFLEQEPTANSD